MRKSATEVRKEGWLYRESGYVNGLVNPRYGAIYPHALVTFRRVSAAWLRVPGRLCLWPPKHTRSAYCTSATATALRGLTLCRYTCGAVCSSKTAQRRGPPLSPACDASMFRACSLVVQVSTAEPLACICAGNSRRTCRPRCGHCTRCAS